MKEYPIREHPDYWDCRANGHNWRKVEYELAGFEFYRCRVCGRCEEDLGPSEYKDCKGCEAANIFCFPRGE